MSVLQKGARLLSPEVQEAEVRRLAAGFGDTELVVLSDLGRSGKDTKRPGYQQLVDALTSGRVSVVYAYSLSRLNRSVRDYSTLVDMCVAERVPVRLVHEGVQDFASPSGRFVATVLAAAAQMQREIDSERQKDSIRARTGNGERHGEPPYGAYEWESVEAVIQAFEAAGSVNGAARLLTDWGIPSRRGDAWRRSSVLRVLKAQAPGARPPGQSERVKAVLDFRLARVLRCHCGRTLTAFRQGEMVRYRCHESVIGTHGKMSIAESHILDWVKTEASRFDRARILEQEAPDTERASLEDRHARIVEMYEMGVIDRAELQRRSEAIQDALERLQERWTASALPEAIDWEDDEPRAVNAVLRAYWDYVQLGPDLMPVKAAWRFDPEAAA